MNCKSGTNAFFHNVTTPLWHWKSLESFMVKTTTSNGHIFSSLFIMGHWMRLSDTPLLFIISPNAVHPCEKENHLSMIGINIRQIITWSKKLNILRECLDSTYSFDSQTCLSFTFSERAFDSWIKRFIFVKIESSFHQSLDAIIILPPFHQLHGTRITRFPAVKGFPRGFWWMMFCVWRSLPVRVTQFNQAVAAHKSLLSPTFLVFYLLSLSHARVSPRSVHLRASN